MPQSSSGQHPERGNSQRGCFGCEKVSQTSADDEKRWGGLTSTISEQRFSGDMKVINMSVFDLFRYLFELLTTGCCKRACVPCEPGENNTICLSATLERSCLQIKTNSGYPWFPWTITLKWGGLVCQSGRAHTGGLLCNWRNEGVEAKAWQTNNRRLEPRGKKKGISVVSSRKHLFQIRLFKAEMQRSPRPRTPQKGIYTSGRRVNTVRCTCASLGILWALGEVKIWLLHNVHVLCHLRCKTIPAADWGEAPQRACFQRNSAILRGQQQQRAQNLWSVSRQFICVHTAVSTGEKAPVGLIQSPVSPLILTTKGALFFFYEF